MSQITLSNNTPSQIFNLRDYQKQVIGEIYRHYRWGSNEITLSLPALATSGGH